MQLGGVCDKKFHANNFDEMAALSKQHAMEMFQQRDEPHMKAMNEMQKLMQSPGDMNAWMDKKRKELNSLPDDI